MFLGLVQRLDRQVASFAAWARGRCSASSWPRIFLPDGGEDLDRDLEVEVGHGPADDQRLLEVLLSEIGGVGLDDVERAW